MAGLSFWMAEKVAINSFFSIENQHPFVEERRDKKLRTANEQSENKLPKGGDEMSSKIDKDDKVASAKERESVPTRIEMTSSVFEEIKKTIGSQPAETGGILGMQGNRIDHFYFDADPENRTRVTYSPNCDAINEVLKQWTPKDVVYMGAIHSHPSGISSPSLGDRIYVERLLKHSEQFDKAKPYFYMPIVQSSADVKEFQLFSYIACHRNNEFTVEPIDLYIDGKPYKPAQIVSKPAYEPQKSPVVSNSPSKPPKPLHFQNTFTKDQLKDKLVICVGAESAEIFIKIMAEQGIKYFVLLDDARTCGLQECNNNKAALVKERILSKFPTIEVISGRGVVDGEKFPSKLLKYIEKFQNTTSKNATSWLSNALIVDSTNRFSLDNGSLELAKKMEIPYIYLDSCYKHSALDVIFKLRYRPDTHTINYRASKSTNKVSASYPLSEIYKYVSLLLLSNNLSCCIFKYLQDFAEQNFLKLEGHVPSGSAMGSPKVDMLA